MARQVFEDFLHSMRFHVIAEDIGGFVPLQMPGYPDAGFTAVTLPELQVESVEYKEGTMIYPEKYPGNATVSSDLTFSRGVTRRDSSFWTWIRGVAEGTGGGNYRATLSIKQYHRERALPREFPGVGTVNATRLDVDVPARIYHCYECFPVRHKPGADLDASTSEVSIMELDVALEHFEIEEDTSGKTRGDA